MSEANPPFHNTKLNEVKFCIIENESLMKFIFYYYIEKFA